MRRQDKFRSLLLILLILFLAANINAINSFLSVQTDRTVDFGHSVAVVPQAWNTTEELNLTNQSKTPHAITNEYVYIDHWMTGLKTILHQFRIENLHRWKMAVLKY